MVAFKWYWHISLQRSWQKYVYTNIVHIYSLWQALSHPTIIFVKVTLTLKFDLLSKALTLAIGWRMLSTGYSPPFKFCWIPLSSCREEVEHVSANQRPRLPSLLSDRPHETHNWLRALRSCSCQVSLHSLQQLQRRSRNVSANQRPGRPSWFQIHPKNTNLIVDVAILLPVKFRWILFSAFRERVENVKS